MRVPITGELVGAEVHDEADHFMTCRACGQAFDMRDLEAVFYHEEPGHEPRPLQS